LATITATRDTVEASPLRAEIRGNARVLIVAPEPLARLVALTLDHGTFRAQIVAGPGEAPEAIDLFEPHLTIVDLDLGVGALSLLKRGGPGGVPAPCIALTRRGDLKAKLAALDNGADDILVVPFSPEELVARALALMRRAYGKGPAFVPLIKIRELEIDLLNQEVKAGAAPLKLTTIEQALLYLLASNPGELMTREFILDTIWGTDYVAESNIVDRHVRNLRRKLKDDWKRPRYIATVAGKGYRFLDA
jgi:two-component system alkaline phosphatase synthesis response regulator PhoP